MTRFRLVSLLSLVSLCTAVLATASSGCGSSSDGGGAAGTGGGPGASGLAGSTGTMAGGGAAGTNGKAGAGGASGVKDTPGAGGTSAMGGSAGAVSAGGTSAMGGSAGAVSAEGMSESIMVGQGACFTLATGTTTMDNPCKGDLYFEMGSNIDLSGAGAEDTPYCLPPNGEPAPAASLADVPSDYATCTWSAYVEGGSGLANTGFVARDATQTHHYRVHITSNTLPTLVFEYAKID